MHTQQQKPPPPPPPQPPKEGTERTTTAITSSAEPPHIPRSRRDNERGRLQLDLDHLITHTRLYLSPPALISHLKPTSLSSSPHLSPQALISLLKPSSLTSSPHLSPQALICHLKPTSLTSSPHLSLFRPHTCHPSALVTHYPVCHTCHSSALTPVTLPPSHLSNLSCPS
ncbi:hypothetical protein Pcinc_037688 [Petrolisthes cinctipes]|uniref:Uncharacterized protein n=1 Tax=Petrolisthes cinctipes TaxID=88211 RepID=A0AAE1BT15_PETCI|nr:hypothetical protein Pcinc_037688 [Petrolisthes cinctipes]